MRKFTEPEITVAGLTLGSDVMLTLLATSTGNNHGGRYLIKPTEEDKELAIEKDYWSGK